MATPNRGQDPQVGNQMSIHILSFSSSLSSTVSVSSNVSQVNGVNIEGLRHSEVVALIRAGGEEVRLLVVDPETDELFHSLGITPTTSHEKGQIVHAHIFVLVRTLIYIMHYTSPIA